MLLLLGVLAFFGFACLCVALTLIRIAYAGVVAAWTNIKIGTGSTPYASWSKNESLADTFIFIYFNRHTRILDDNKMVFGAKIYRSNFDIAGIEVPDTFKHQSSFLGWCCWLVELPWCTLETSIRIPNRLNTTLFILAASSLCAHLRSTKNSLAIGYFDLLRISGDDSTKPSAVALIPILIFTQTFPSGRLSAGWYLTHSSLNIPDLPKNTALADLLASTFPLPYQDMNLHYEPLDRRRNSYCCHSDSCIRPHTNPSSWSLVGWLTHDLSALYTTHSRSTPKIGRLDPWNSRSAGIYKFLHLPWTSTFLAPWWRLIHFAFVSQIIPFPKINHFSIVDLSAANLFRRHFGFQRSPGNDHLYLLPCRHLLIFQAYLRITFAAAGLLIHSRSIEKRNLNQQLSI